jgi:nucleoside-diphosphate-sugar epimerase
MKALVTGANGFIGTHLAEHLERRGWSVVRIGRTGARLDLTADLTRAEPCELADRIATVDVVYHCAGLAHRRAGTDETRLANVEATRRMYALARLVSARRLVFLSSARVLGEVSRHPFRTGDARSPADPYAESKALAEEYLESVAGTGPDVTVVRAPLVYGPGVKANFRLLLGAVLRGWPLPLGRAVAPRSLVAVGNLVDLLVACLADERGHRVLHVRDPNDLSVADLVRAIAAADGRRPRLVPVPEPIVRAALALTGRRALGVRLFEPAQLDDRATRHVLGWRPPISTTTALEETVAWWHRSRS